MTRFYKLAVEELKSLETIKVSETGKPLYRSRLAGEHFEQNITIQYVPLVHDKNGTLWLACDEDGLMKRLPLNFFLGETDKEAFFKGVETRNCPYPVQAIVGDVLFMRTEYCNPMMEEIYDYEIVDLTADDVAYIMKLLTPATQKMFYDVYVKMYG